LASNHLKSLSMESTVIFSIAILIMSVVIHEVSHGYAALALGDVTAKYAGRLTLNPIKHLDLFGSIIVPGLLALLPGGLIFGWAKPVPYNPYNLKNQRWGELIVAAAGPLSNIIIAIIFGVLIRLAPVIGLAPSFIDLSLTVVLINLILAFFNLLPFPPLDGSKILFSLLPYDAAQKYREFIQRFGLILVFIAIFILWDFLFLFVLFLTEILTGLNIF
jgi:Zn-dependent protease